VNKPHHKGHAPTHPKAPPNPFVEVTIVFRDTLNHPIEGLAVRVAAGTGAPSAPAWAIGPDTDEPAVPFAPESATSAPVATVNNSTDAVTDGDGYAITIHNAARNRPLDVLVRNRHGQYVLRATVTPTKDVTAYVINSPEYHLEAVTQLTPKDAFEQDLTIPVMKDGEIMTVHRLVNEFGPYIGSAQKVTEQGKVKKDFPTKKKEVQTDPATGKPKTSITVVHHYRVVDTGKPRTIAINLLASRLNFPKTLDISDAKYAEIARKINCEVAAVRAVAETESSGSGFCDNGLPKIRFERHYFFRASLPENKRASGVWQKQKNPFPKVPDLSWPKSGGYSVGEPSDDGTWTHSGRDVMYQYERMIRAANLNSDAALMACSWGAFQVMGYFYKECGYSSPEALANSVMTGINEQLDLFFAYVSYVSPIALDALKHKNWQSFAQAYNGTDCPPSYAATMKKNYDKYK
jgi:hypothetical protein